MPSCLLFSSADREYFMKRAEHVARVAHKGQVHRDGRDAIEHPLRVAAGFRTDPELFAIAVLHDVIEDCPRIDYWYLRELFGQRVADAVDALSRGEQESWNHYIRRLSRNADAIRVKIADIEDNIARADDKFRAKLPMYETTLARLKGMRESMDIVLRCHTVVPNGYSNASGPCPCKAQ